MLRSLGATARRAAVSSKALRTTQLSRTVVIMRNRNRPAKKTKSPSDWLTVQMEGLEKLTNEVKMGIEKQQEKEKLEEISHELKIDDDIDFDKSLDEDVDEIFDMLNDEKKTAQKQLGSGLGVEGGSSGAVEGSEGDPLALFPPVTAYLPLSNSITSQLDTETIENITTKETANWVPVIEKLGENPGGLKETSRKDFHTLIRSIPQDQRAKVAHTLQEIARKSNLLHGVVMYNDLMASYNRRDPRESLPEVEELYDSLVKSGTKPNVATVSIMINAYSRTENLPKVREFLGVLAEMGEKPTKEIYTSVLQLYGRMDKYEQAAEVFDTMKFLSRDTSPSTKTYSSMILLDTLHNNVEHAVSLYEEMIDNQVAVSPGILTALARGCAMRPKMVAQGWSYILQYYAQGFPINYTLIETMMRLAERDSDIDLVRALYLSIFETTTKAAGRLTPANPEALKYLLNAYFRFDPDHRPVSAGDPRVGAIKNRSLQLMNFDFDDQAPPMLPALTLNQDSSLMLQECRALFNYHMLKYPDIVSKEILEAYLFVLAKYSSLDEFEEAWNKYTFLPDVLDGEVTIDPERPEEPVSAANKEEETIPAEKILERYPVSRFPRSDRLYNACLHAARFHRDIDFAQKVWTERGRFRKSPAFQRLSLEAQDAADFKFARAMLSVFTETGHAVDAYKLVLSSQNRFVWSYYHLKALINLCERLGFTTLSKELKTVINKGNRFARRQQRQQRQRLTH